MRANQLASFLLLHKTYRWSGTALASANTVLVCGTVLAILATAKSVPTGWHSTCMAGVWHASCKAAMSVGEGREGEGGVGGPPRGRVLAAGTPPYIARSILRGTR